jgi:AAA15 family ATPase/GTPase
MKISNIQIENYRGIKTLQNIPLSNLTSIVGKNDSGKSIILNAIASFLDPKTYPITNSDFNNPASKITIECQLQSDSLLDILASKLKSKVKKEEGLEDFVKYFVFDNSIVVKKEVNGPKKGFDIEYVKIMDYDNPDFQNLYLKKDLELNELLEKHKIKVPVDGKGRNSKVEKISHIHTFCSGNGINLIESYIEDEYKISSLLPEVELFSSDYGLEADTSFRSQSVTEIKDYFDREAAKDAKLDIVEKEIIAEMQIEAEAIKGYMEGYVSSIQKVEILPTIDWKAAVKSVDVSFQFTGDERPIPMSHKGTGYRRMFMVARFRYLAEKNKGMNIVYLIEEPETFLHPSAQEDLLNAFRELSDDNQIVLSSHSPVFVGATNKDSVVLCKRSDESMYEYLTAGNEIEFTQNIVKELGIKPSFNLTDNFEKILFVEGKDDATFYNLVCKKVLGIEFDEKVLVLPVGGSSVDSFVNITYFKRSGRDLYLIQDSDKGLSLKDPKKPLTQIKTHENFKSSFGSSYLLNKSNVESYFHPRALERYYHHLTSGEIHYFEDDEYLPDFFKTKGINKKHNIQIFDQMTKGEFEEVVEAELITFLKIIVGSD